MRGLFCICIGASVADTASAGPWPQERGRAFARLGLLAQQLEGLEAGRAEAYAEYGLTDAWTVTVKAEGVAFANNSDFNQFGYRATVRRPIWRRKTALVALEGGVVGGEAIGGLNTGCETIGAEARLTTGASGVNRGRRWFAFADVAARFHTAGCSRRRLEFGAGREFARDWYLLSQFFLERGTDDARSDKWEGGVLRRFGAVDVSLTWRQELSDRFDERGVVVALSRRF